MSARGGVAPLRSGANRVFDLLQVFDLVQGALKVLRQRGSYGDRAGGWRTKFKLREMQPQSATSQRLDRKTAIKRISHDRMPKVSQMYPNLMAHSGLRPRTYQRE